MASGTAHKTLPLFEKADKNIQPYLFYEVFPLLKKRQKTIVIIGAGDAAFDNAISLAKYNKVIICNYGEDIKAITLLYEKALKHPNITYCSNYKLLSVSLGKVSNLECVFVNHEKSVRINADYIIAAIGRVPQKNFYTNNLKLSEKKLIKSGKLRLIGDVKNHIYRQVAIAAGDGIVAAMHVFDDIKNIC